MAGSDQEQGPVKPSEQRGGTTPDEAAREKGPWAGIVAEGIVPAELCAVTPGSRTAGPGLATP